jgi:hypothetical protein
VAVALQARVDRTESDCWHLVKNEAGVAAVEAGHDPIAKVGCASAGTYIRVPADETGIASPRALAFVVGQDWTFVRAIYQLYETVPCWCHGQDDAGAQSHGENRAILEDDRALLNHSVPGAVGDRDARLASVDSSTTNLHYGIVNAHSVRKDPSAELYDWCADGGSGACP